MVRQLADFFDDPISEEHQYLSGRAILINKTKYSYFHGAFDQ